jgi:RNA polymerase sigma factor (sigma-70 family)
MSADFHRVHASRWYCPGRPDSQPAYRFFQPRPPTDPKRHTQGPVCLISQLRLIKIKRVFFRVLSGYQVMGGLSQPGSSTLLLQRLCTCPTDADAWGRFVERYGGTIYRWAGRCGLQDADARDVTQTVFTRVLRALPNFDRSRARFRTWLYRIAQNAVRDWCADPAQRQARGTEGARQRLACETARRDLRARLAEEFDVELLEVGEAIVRLQVSPATWDAYQCRCKEGLSLREAADRIGMPAGHISKYALRVRDMVARQVGLLERRPGRDTGAAR